MCVNHMFIITKFQYSYYKFHKLVSQIGHKKLFEIKLYYIPT